MNKVVLDAAVEIPAALVAAPPVRGIPRRWSAILR